MRLGSVDFVSQDEVTDEISNEPVIFGRHDISGQYMVALIVRPKGYRNK